MGSTGWFLPILFVFCIAVSLLFGLIDQWTQPKGSYDKWLEKKLKRDPDYINWLKVANSRKDYKLGLKILRKVERKKDNLYKKWLKRMRKIGKY